MAMVVFPHHPNNHPNSPEESDLDHPPKFPNTYWQREARKTALITLIKKLQEAQTIIAQSQARPPLSDQERTTALPSPTRLPKVSASKRRPPKLDLRHQRPDDNHADAIFELLSPARRARIAAMPPQRAPRRMLNRYLQRQSKRRACQAATDSDIEVQVQAAQVAARGQNVFVRFWDSMSWMEKVVLDIMLLICVTAACVLPFVVRYAKKAGYH